MSTVSVVIPTVGRPSLRPLLETLVRGARSPATVVPPIEIIVVDDRGTSAWVRDLDPGVRVLAGPGQGPAAARNAGWRAARGEWVAFLDDDVLPTADWFDWLAADLMVPPDVAGVQGVVAVPQPIERRPTDWERSVAGLAEARWITADIAYRRSVLAAVDGFDERFRRAYREDAELALRVRRSGHRLVVGERRVTHPVRPEDHWISVRAQRGNADDALMRRLYGPQWRELAEVPPGRRIRHVAVTVAGVAAVCLAAIPASRLRPAAAAAALAWVVGTAEFAGARIAAGPRTADEILTMVVTSAVIPPLAVYHWLRGWVRFRGARSGAAPTALAPLTIPRGPRQTA
jgi:hypothetical protein